MFEKEENEQKIIDDYVKVHFPRECAGIEPLTIEDVKQAYQDGIEKANEWHFVKDGDLPKNENSVWLCFGVDDYNYGQFIRGRFWCDDCGWYDVEEVVAWQEIIPPNVQQVLLNCV